MASSAKITPVILSGGSGTRLWPMSRAECPKQFLALTAPQTMFSLTLSRTEDPTRFERPIIVAGAAHTGLIESQLAGRDAILIIEPSARNTAPAIALAALAADGAILVMPSDHVIADVAAFMAAIEKAMPLVDDGWLVTFGIAPDSAQTGYGYIQTGEQLAKGVHQVARFVEKPDVARAQAMITSGDHVWNGGIFLFRADAYLSALSTHAPEMLNAVEQSMSAAVRTGNQVFPSANAFAGCPANSIDYAVMEKADRVAVVPVSMGWSDIGSWDALYDLGAKDAAGNVSASDAMIIDSHNNLIRSDGIRISVAGVSDLVIIASGNDVMIVPRGQSQAVKSIVEARKAQDAG
jgi:mannose-1-phosphate guanylyltransferase